VNTALIVIDVQESLIAEGPWNAEDVLNRIAGLIAAARAAGAPVLFVRDHRVKPDRSIHPRFHVRDEDAVVDKNFCDSFLDTGLQDRLRSMGVTRIVIAGLQTDYCIDTTCRRAVSLGFDVLLAADAHTTFDHEHLGAEQIVLHHNRVLRNLAAGACRVTVTASAEITFE
jgi:nicotinamidase-related amidase